MAWTGARVTSLQDKLATRRGFEPPIGSPLLAARDTENRSLLFANSQGSDQTIPSPRECDCPEWVLRCAHYEGQSLTLWNYLVFPLPNDRFAVSTHPGAVQTGLCDCGQCSGFVYDNDRADFRYLYSGSSEADALAAFYAAEEALLRGDA